MQTKILKPTKDAVALACKLLKDGEIVAIPTETVYGLAGDCRNPVAIQKIFNAKGRPQDNPLSQAHNLFTKLRELDKLNAKIVYARCPETSGAGIAVYNRLIRSAGFKIVNL